MLGKIEGKRKRGWKRMRWLDSITDSVDMNLSKLWEIVEDRGDYCFSPLGRKESDITTEQPPPPSFSTAPKRIGEQMFTEQVFVQ